MSENESDAEASADIRAAAIKAAIGKYLELGREYHAAKREKERAEAAKNAADARLLAAVDGHAQLVNMGRLFGFDLVKEYQAWDEKQSRLPNSKLRAEPATATEIAAAVVEADKPKLTIKDQVAAAARDSYPNPVRASALRKQLEVSGLSIHEKTIGMTLYRLSREGVIRRQGWDWFFVPESQRENVAPKDEESLGDEPGLDLHAAE